MLIDHARRRDEMVRQQLAGRGIHDAQTVQAMGRVPRERFVPGELAEFAYDDAPLPLTEDQTISQPYIVALMTEALELEHDDRVLEVGTGSGYSAAVLAEIAAEVFTIERHQALADAAKARLDALGYRNAHVRCGDGTRGWPDEAPFDAIVVTAGGPEVPESLRSQLAVGGRLVIPVGLERVQRLLRIRRTSEDRYADEDLGAVLFVPLIGAQGWGAEPAARPERGPRPAEPAEIVAGAAEPFDRLEHANLAPLLGRIGGSRVILLGEATHGTAEFYAMRARITRELIERGNVRIVAVEGDWPDAHQIDRFVRGAEAAAHPERAFARFPSWMWANRQALDLIRSLRDFNSGRDDSDKARFYGLDLYSLYTSVRAVLAYLDNVDKEAAAVARARYGCLEPWEGDPGAYGAAALRGRFDECADDVVRMLEDLLQQRIRYEQKDGDRYFDAVRNAALIRDAESYYRSLYYGPHQSWNLRDRHMFDTLRALLAHHGDARAVVWAHNSHLGNAAATSMSARGETNLGELCKEAFGADCYAIGFGTDHGTVAAADEWGGPMEVMDVKPAHEDSYERICHDSAVPSFLLPLSGPAPSPARDVLMPERLERAIGVIYRPLTERSSHYFHATLPAQFDEWIWFDETEAVTPLAAAELAGVPDTYPFGL